MHRAIPYALILLSTTRVSGAEKTVDYVRQIKPILKAKCYSCHGALKQQSGLRLETRALMVKGGDSGAAIRPGVAAKSLMVHRLTAGKDERMPPADSLVSPLSQRQIALIRAWIDQGAQAPREAVPKSPREHWSFKPVTRPAVPPIQSRWIRNPIDAFVAQQHRRLGLRPQRPATPMIQLRRLYLDLVGVLPPPQEVARLSDADAGWYEQTVTKLMKDPRYGERWGRHWMDIWRYSDWWGLGGQLRNSQHHIWHWRDWIIESLNQDLPYNEMIRQMLAADELYPRDLKKLRATGFLARNYFLFNRQQWMEETVEHVSKGFLALTMNCAKCHDHKFDPLSQRDYYRMRAFFEPYHVRLDVVPRQPDLKIDGVPRVFDGLPNEPTYLLIRGNVKDPDKSRVIKPGLPRTLSQQPLRIKPVDLPVEAWQPARRQWVVEANVDAIRAQVKSAQRIVQTATKRLSEAKQSERIAAKTRKKSASKKSLGKKSSGSRVILDDRFERLDKQRWTLIGGNWRHRPGNLRQSKDGPTRSVLRYQGKVPRDFEATLRFSFLGGRKWRSVGLSFDAAEHDPRRDTSPKYHEQNVYLSANSSAPKIHASFNNGGKWQFPPPPAVKRLSLALNRPYTLRVRVRGELINAAVNGRTIIACRTPMKRRDGYLQVTAFDVLAVIHQVTIKELSPQEKLFGPGLTPPSSPSSKTRLALATAVYKVAQARLAMTQAHLRAVEQAAKAIVSTQSSDKIAAVRAYRQYLVAQARYDLAAAEQRQVDPTLKQKKGAPNVAAARKALQAATVQSHQPARPTDKFVSFVGARWTPTRFFNSTRDDPEVKFQRRSTGRRTALAKWIASRRNPLTARVAVNHIWARHMGRPLVPTVFDFGRNGARPTHPQLLDWLAAELMANNWSMKHIHRLIVTSATYRMSSSEKGLSSNVSKDRDNRFLWRRVPIRLESQAIRDCILALAGELDPQQGGPPVPQNQQGKSKRRSIYFFHSHVQRNLFLNTFDEASVKECYRRDESIVPQQSLALINSPLVLDAAPQIAARLSQAGDNEDQFIRRAFATILGITASPNEIAASKQALHKWKNLPKSTAVRARANLMWALINHNDFITLR